jgi:hypothetical protein
VNSLPPWEERRRTASLLGVAFAPDVATASTVYVAALVGGAALLRRVIGVFRPPTPGSRCTLTSITRAILAGLAVRRAMGW